MMKEISDPTIFDPTILASVIRKTYWNKYPELTDYLNRFIRPVDLIVTVITSLEMPNFYSNFYDLVDAALPPEESEAIDLPTWEAFFAESAETIIEKMQEICQVDDTYFEAVDETDSGMIILYPEGYARATL